MTEAVMRRDTLMPRPPGGMGPGLLLALLVHVALVVAIAFSVRWRASEPVGMEAELWSSIPQAAAPPAPPPPPPPAPAPQPQPPAPAPPEPQAQADAEIALEKARLEEAEQRRREEAQRLAEQKRKAEEEKRLAEERKAREEKRLAEERKAQEDKRLAEQRRKAEEQKRVAEERRLAEQERERAAELEQARQRRLERLMAQAGGDPSSTGTAARSAGPSAGYAGRIKARIKPNIVFTDSPVGNPQAEVEVKLAPDGTIVSHKLTRPSGLPEWDDAVMRAIERTQSLPRDIDGTIPDSMVLAFRPKD